MPHRVLDISFSRTVVQVVQPRILLVAVVVTNLLPFRRGSNEREHDKTVDATLIGMAECHG